MRPPEPRRRPPGWRTVNATLAGIVAGVGGVVLTRATLGGGEVLSGTLVGLTAMVAGASISLFLTAPGRRRGRTGAERPRRVHPVAWFTPAAGSAVAVLAWGAVAHSSGSGWVQAIGALMAAVLAVGIVAPVVPARRASVHCTASPSDGQAGRADTLTLAATGPIRITPRRPAGPATRAAGPDRGPRAVEVTVTPDRRGVIRSVVLEVASCAPFGLLWWAREIEVALARPFHVAPRPGATGPVGTLSDTSTGEAVPRVPAGVGEPRGVRPYQPGDTRGSVHWPATSHVGSLMVRESERQADDPIVIELVLPTDPVEAEARAERAMAVIGAHLARGRRVLLGTSEPEGHRRQAVRDRIDLGRRLARAVPPPVVPAEDPGTP
ncbi:MAG: DUF58 domain-containing protein [Acidimicrobiales bacterium]